MKKNLSEVTSSELRAIYIMYRDGDDYYSFDEIKSEYERRDKNKLWKIMEDPKPFVKFNEDGSIKEMKKTG